MPTSLDVTIPIVSLDGGACNMVVAPVHSPVRRAWQLSGNRVWPTRFVIFIAHNVREIQPGRMVDVEADSCKLPCSDCGRLDQNVNASPRDVDERN